MFHEKLYENVLIKPAIEGSNKLYIVSGYATAAMAFHHINKLKSISSDISIDLIVGMTSADGVSNSNHNAFNKLVTEDFRNILTCSYVCRSPPVHSKLYIWERDGELTQAFIGSANYTQNAFILNKNREICATCDPSKAFNYYESLVDDTFYCDYTDIENEVSIHKDGNRPYRREPVTPGELIDEDYRANVPDSQHVSLSFLNPRTRELPTGASGLNWGQRKGREPNQAYIRISSNIAKTDFFPPRAVHFTVQTDDGKILICTRAQDGAKSIETPHNNSLIGEYFRHRLGLANGQKIYHQDLINYGRTDVDFYKLDDETYYMDFSV